MTRTRTAVLVTGMALGLLAPAVPASAATKTVNIIKDSGAERAKQSDPSGVTIVPLAFWTPFKGTGFPAVKYGSPEFNNLSPSIVKAQHWSRCPRSRRQRSLSAR